jgi:hypothetical protein
MRKAALRADPLAGMTAEIASDYFDAASGVISRAPRSYVR